MHIHRDVEIDIDAVIDKFDSDGETAKIENEMMMRALRTSL